VISANKQAIGPSLAELEDLAQANGATFAYSAAVGGGAPVIETLLRARRHGPVARVEGVLNGTVNFLLNQLGGGAAFSRRPGRGPPPAALPRKTPAPTCRAWTRPPSSPSCRPWPGTIR
jgi:hypothetical protein